MFNSTIILITEYEPKVSNAQKRVKLLIPVSSNVVKSTRPNEAQNRDWEVSNKLKKKPLVAKVLQEFVQNSDWFGRFWF